MQLIAICSIAIFSLSIIHFQLSIKQSDNYPLSIVNYQLNKVFKFKDKNQICVKSFSCPILYIAKSYLTGSVGSNSFNLSVISSAA